MRKLILALRYRTRVSGFAHKNGSTVLARLRRGRDPSFRRPSAREAAEFAPVGLAPHGETRAADRSAPLPATSRALLASLARPLVPRSRLPAAMPADSNSRHRATA